MLPGLCTADSLDSAYHDNAEILEFLLEMQESYPEFVKVDSIGHSSEYGLPIYMAKLSDNPDVNEPEASLLFIGQIHAEEIMGIELVLELMRILLENREADPYARRLNNLQLFFVPTMNPEGLQVVHSLDYTFRKNCRDNLGDGTFRYREGPGEDTSGVDLNRNFGLHWDRGDTLFQDRGIPYLYNYYAGPAPFSEPETRAIRDIALEQRFLFSINYHSSRSGNNAEKVIGPWYWDGRYPIDRDAIDDLGEQLASLIPTANGENTYEFVNATQRNGQSQDWFYQAVGTFQYMIEIGAEVQPDSAEMRAVVEDNLTAAFYLMDLALGQQALDGFGILTVVATDAATDEPISATIRIDERNSPVIEDRKTSSTNGRFDWLLRSGLYNIEVSAFGYRSDTRLNFEIIEDQPRVLNAHLVPLQRVQTRFTIVDIETQERIETSITITDDYGIRHSYPAENGLIEVNIPAGYYPYSIIADGYLPVTGNILLDRNTDTTIALNPTEVIFTENFDMNRGWLRGGTGGDWGVVFSDGRIALNESENGPYREDMNCWLTVDPQITLDTLHASVLKIVHRPYFEPGSDFGYLLVENPETGRWIELAEFSEFPDGWRKDFYSLVKLGNGETRILFNVTSDSRVEEDGWLIDKIEIYRSITETPVETSDTNTPVVFSLDSFPNPFNNSMVISLYLPEQTRGNLSLFDINGREISSIFNGSFDSGQSRFHLRNRNLTSGLYLLRFTGKDRQVSKPVTILR